MNRYKIVCGNPGTGKSTFIKAEHSNYILIDCDIPFMERTYAIIETALSLNNKNRNVNHQEVLSDFFTLLSLQDGIIIDNTEIIDINTLKIIVNDAKLLEIPIVFIFDIPYRFLHTYESFIKLLEWNIIDIRNQLVDFCVKSSVIQQFIQNECPLFSDAERKKLLRITGYNFNEIKKLVWINKIGNSDPSELSNQAILDYQQNKVEKQLSQLEPILSDVLKKSSVIGQVFEKHPLESIHGFNILGLSNYLYELELLGTFISKLLDRIDYYQFISTDIHTAILSLIHSSQKSEWQELLKNYYLYLCNHASHDCNKTESLIKAKHMALELSDRVTVNRLNRVLLYQYLKEHDPQKAIQIIDELSVSGIEDKTYLDYLALTKLNLLLGIGNYKQSLIITKKYVMSKDYTGSKDYLIYHHVRCLYNCGDIDKALFYINNLIERIKRTSRSGASEQKIYPLAYSMMASIQNHLGLEDNGKRYYLLALNHAYNNIQDKNLYFSILSKCDMFFSSDYAITRLEKSAEYFKEHNDWFQAARVYFNLATESLFCGCTSYEIIEKHFGFAKNVFQLPDENLAYLKNNYALFLMMKTKDFQTAVYELESSLFVGLSDFTYMTIYLNISMCYYFLYGNQNDKFFDAYQKFRKYEKRIESRKNRTQYEVIYRIIAEIVFFNRNDSFIRNELKWYWAKNSNESYFRTIIQILTNKRSYKLSCQKGLNDNKSLFEFINEYGLFLAEFRFWD